MTGRSTTSLDPVTTVTKLNRTMGGWANYFCLGPVSTAYRAVDGYATMRLRHPLVIAEGGSIPLHWMAA
jgi:RNA-directed DNA polymerase